MKTHSQIRIIAGVDRGRKILTPRDRSIRPTSSMAREAIFNILQDRIGRSHFLDLYAGSGAVGLEALSRGAKTVTLVESSREAVEMLRENVAMMERSDGCRLRSQSALAFCEAAKGRDANFDVIFVDPPYDESGVHLNKLEPLLSKDGVVIFQRPLKYAVGDPFKGSSLVEFDARRYGKSVFTFHTFEENLVYDEDDEATEEDEE